MRRGFLVVLAPEGAGGAIAHHLAETDYGFVGVSIEVESLQRAREVLESHDVAIRDTCGFYGEAVLIPPAEKHGMWIELFLTHEQLRTHRASPLVHARVTGLVGVDVLASRIRRITRRQRWDVAA